MAKKPKKQVKTPAKKAAPAPKAKKTTPSKKVASAKAPAGKVKHKASGLKEVISKKAKPAPASKGDIRRSKAAAAVEAALGADDDEEESDDDEEFDPAAFLAASGGKGLIRAHVMRKERVDLSLPIRYRFLTGPLVSNAILLNLSKSGLSLEGPEVLKAKTVIRIEIPLPHTSELFAVQAEVIWSDPKPGTSGKKRPAVSGLNFLPMSIVKQAVINNFIQQRRDELIMAKIGLDRFSESVPVAGLD